MRRELCSEAIRLGRLLRELLPAAMEVAGLLALMLLHDSRRAARLDARGELVALQLVTHAAKRRYLERRLREVRSG